MDLLPLITVIGGAVVGALAPLLFVGRVHKVIGGFVAAVMALAALIMAVDPASMKPGYLILYLPP